MQNLAGRKDSSDIAKDELEAAGIPVVVLPEPQDHEVRSRFGGRLGGFEFTRGWYYWRVDGRMPLAAAEPLHAHPEAATSVRVAGHCGCPPPAEWAEWRDDTGALLVEDPHGKEQVRYQRFSETHPHLVDGERLRFVADPSKVHGATAYVTSYHVDTAEVLRLLADAVRGLSQDEETAAA